MHGLGNTHKELTVKDIQATVPSSFCKYDLIPIYYNSHYNSIFIIKNKNNKLKILITSQNNIFYSLVYKYALFLIYSIYLFYFSFILLFLIYSISPDNSIIITKNKTPRSLGSNNILLVPRNIDNTNRRKYNLHEQKLVQYQLLLYEIGFKQYSRYMYSEYNSFHKSYVAEVRHHCSCSLTKLLIKENNKFIKSTSKTRT